MHMSAALLPIDKYRAPRQLDAGNIVYFNNHFTFKSSLVEIVRYIVSMHNLFYAL